jgi:hypothetical protein
MRLAEKLDWKRINLRPVLLSCTFPAALNLRVVKCSFFLKMLQQGWCLRVCLKTRRHICILKADQQIVSNNGHQITFLYTVDGSDFSETSVTLA